METIHILSTLRFADDLLDQIRAVSPRLHVTQETCHDTDEVASALAAYRATQVLYTFQVPANLLDLAPDLRWIQLHSAGAEHILDTPVAGSNLVVTTSSGIHATPIAEYVFASMLAHRWRVARWTACQREGKWPEGRWRIYARPEIRGKTLGILGYGSIGREVGRLGQAFGMRVLALRRSAAQADAGYRVGGTGDPEGSIPEHFYQPDSLHEMLPLCDYVVIALPHTPETTHFIGEPELRTMKPTAYLVNIARGSIVDEAALIRALGEGTIAGAGLDVFEQEPLPPDSPLWEMEPVLLSPHVAGFTPHYDERAAELFVQNLERYMAGQPLINRVDMTRGY
jgi:phosphoglycerate dehydrogenase-like enzyme